MDKRASEWVYCSKKNFKLMKKILFRLFFLTLIILPIASLIHAGLPVTHDGQDHVARISNFYQNLAEGNIIPRWAANLNWGYGHPILEFLYPLPSYIGSFFHFLGFSLVDSVKIVFALGMILSFYFMYIWLSGFLSKIAALFGAVLYTYAPYRFVELYVRGDIGENLAFAFIPLVLYFVYKIYKSNKFSDSIFGSISLALLILAHNGISLMILPFIFLYSITLIYLSKEKTRTLINLGFLIVLGLGLSAFFWIPGLLEGKYTLRNIVTKDVYKEHFEAFGRFIYSPWNYGGSGQFSVQFGPLAWIAFIFSPFTLFSYKKNKQKFFLIILLLSFSIVSIFLMISVSDTIWSRFILLQNFQFPWRFLAIIVFCSSVLGAFALERFPKSIRLKSGIVLTILAIVLSLSYLSPTEYQHKPEIFYTGIYNSTTDTGESGPIWSIRFMEKKPSARLEVVDGQARVKEEKRTSTYHRYNISVARKTILRENTLYFPGWELKANGKPLEFEFQVPYQNGTMEFSLDKGSYIVEAIFRETKLRIFADVVSLVSFGNIIGGLVIILYLKIKYKKEI